MGHNVEQSGTETFAHPVSAIMTRGLYAKCAIARLQKVLFSVFRYDGIGIISGCRGRGDAGECKIPLVPHDAVHIGNSQLSCFASHTASGC